MNNRLITILTMAVLSVAAGPAFGQGTAFNYQGKLDNGGISATGLYDLTFSLYNASTVGAQQGITITNLATPVTNGLFSVTLDFGNQFPGASRWLDVSVRTNGAVTFIDLAPRQQILSMPYAIQSLSAATAASANSVSAGNISGTISPAQLSSIVLTNGASGVTISGTFNGSGSGLTGVALLNGGNTFTGSQAMSNGLLSVQGTAPIGSPGSSLWISGNDNGPLFTSGTLQSGIRIFNNSVAPGQSTIQGWDYSLNQGRDIVINDAGGKVGIGTSSPSTELEVNGNAQVDGAVTATSFIGNGSGLTNLPIPSLSTNVAFLDSNNLFIGNNTFDGTQTVSNGLLSVQGTAPIGSPGSSLWISGNDNGPLFTSGTLQSGIRIFNNSVAPGQSTIQGWDYSLNQGRDIVINDAGGKVGIGTSSPSTELEVNGNAQVDGTLTATSFSGNGSGLTNLPIPAISTNVALLTGGNTFNGTQIMTNGNVGIGTTSPAMALDISNSDGNQLELDGTDVVKVRFNNPGSQYNWDVVNDNFGWSVSRSGLDYPFGVLENGAVAIGTGRTVTAGDLMEVGGNTKIDGTLTANAFAGNGSGLTGISAANVSGAALLTGGNTFNGTQVVTNGNVGIGTTAPLTSLEIRSSNSSRSTVFSGPGGGTWSTYDSVHNSYLWDITGNTNQFSIAISGVGYPFYIQKSTGNVGIGNTSPGQLFVVGSGGAYCNGTTWVNGSDRNSKHAITAINPQTVLQKISAMPITEWQYKVDPNGIEHIGPMAQDFHAAFGLNGNDDKHISTVDEGGVALAAIQALNQKLDEKNAEVEQLQHNVDELTRLVNSLTDKK